MKENKQEIIKNDLIISSQDIVKYIEDIAAARGWAMDQLPQIQFNFICQAIGQNFFNIKTAYIYNNYNSNNGFNYDMIMYLFDIYYSICNLYNKIPSITSFCYFINIDDSFLFNCNTLPYNNYNNKNIDLVTEDEKRKLLANYIYQKLNQKRESNLLDRAIDKGGAVGVAIVGNYQYSWNDPTKQIQTSANNNQVVLPDFNSQQKAIKGI